MLSQRLKPLIGNKMILWRPNTNYLVIPTQQQHGFFLLNI